MAIPFLVQMVGVLVPLIRKESGQERFSERCVDLTVDLMVYQTFG